MIGRRLLELRFLYSAPLSTPGPYYRRLLRCRVLPRWWGWPAMPAPRRLRLIDPLQPGGLCIRLVRYASDDGTSLWARRRALRFGLGIREVLSNYAWRSTR